MMRAIGQLRSKISGRLLIAIAAAALTLLSASGYVESKAFSQATTLKYVLTIVAPLMVFYATFLKRPFNLFGAALIVAAPVEPATAEFAGMRVSLLVPLSILCFVLIAFERGGPHRRPTLGFVGLLAFPLLLVPIANSSNSSAFSQSLVLLLITGVVTYFLARDPGGAKVAMLAIFGSAALQSAIALWTVESGHQVNLYSTTGGGTMNVAAYNYTFDGFVRPTGMFNDPISLGNVLCVAVPIGLALLFYYRNTTHRLLILAVTALILGGVGAALDRTSWIAAVVGVLFTAVLLPAKDRRQALVGTALGLAGVLAAAIAIGGSTVTGKLWSIVHPTATSGVSAEAKGNAEGEQNRERLWKAAWVYGFEHHPFTGVGIGNITPLMLKHSPASGSGVRAGTGQYANASSTYLQLAAEAGLWALLLFGVLFFGIFSDARAAVRGSPVLGAGIVGAIVALLICWVTDVVVYGHAVASWEGVLFGALAGLSTFYRPGGERPAVGAGQEGSAVIAAGAAGQS